MLTVTLLVALLVSPAWSTDQFFTVSLRLLKPIVMTEVHALSFPDANTGVGQDLVVHASSTDAGAFEVVGSKNIGISSSVVENSIMITSPDTDTAITVDGFTLSSPHVINDQGKATVKVGGTAHILADAKEGDYSGTATLRVVYL